MGYGLGPAANAAFDGGGERRAISILGDGGFWHNGLTSSIGNMVSTIRTVWLLLLIIIIPPLQVVRTFFQVALKTRPRTQTTQSKAHGNWRQLDPYD